MGAFTSAIASQEMVRGFVPDPHCRLLFPVTRAPVRRTPRATALVHGWDDELCPVDDAIAFARARGDAITLVKDDHRLGAHVDFIAQIFGQFLERFA